LLSENTPKADPATPTKESRETPDSLQKPEYRPNRDKEVKECGKAVSCAVK
jgi:hypothetical protein